MTPWRSSFATLYPKPVTNTGDEVRVTIAGNGTSRRRESFSQEWDFITVEAQC